MKKGKGWLILLVLVLIAFIGGGGGMKYSSKKYQDRLSSQIQKEKGEREKALKMAEVVRMTKAMAVENEQLRAENALLVAQLKDCKPVPETKKVVPRVGKPRKPYYKRVAKTVQPKPTPQPAPKMAVLPPQKENLAEKMAKVCGGPAELVDGKWRCVKKEVAKAEPTPVVTTEPDTFFAGAVDDEAEETQVEQASARQRVVIVAPPACPAYIDVFGMSIPEGYRRRPGGSICECGSPRC